MSYACTPFGDPFALNPPDFYGSLGEGRDDVTMITYLMWRPMWSFSERAVSRTYIAICYN